MQLELYDVYETPRLQLRAMRLSDANDLFQIFRDARVTNHLLMQQVQSIEEAKRFMRIAYLSYRQLGVPEAMVVVHKATQRVIGICNMHTLKNDDMGEIGFMMHADYQGMGYISEVMPIFIDILFDVVGVRRIEVLHDERNKQSQRVIEKAGFVYEGRMREYYEAKDGTMMNVLLYSIIKHEWKGAQHEKRISSKV